MLENRIQQECFMWFHNEYPQYRGLLCYNLNNSKNKIQGNINKAMGLQPGRADMTLYFNGTALFIEMKTETGSQSSAQKSWQNVVENQGFEYVIVKNIKDFKKIIKKYLEY